MNVGNLIHQVADLAKNVAALMGPGGQLVGGGIAIGEKVIDLIDHLKEHATPAQQPELQQSRATLARAIEAHAHSTAAGLRGQ